MAMYLLVRERPEIAGPALGAGLFEAPRFADEEGRGCLVPRGDLTVITGEQASAMQVIDRCLILGRFTTHPDGLAITDSRVEAFGAEVAGGSGPTSGLLARAPGTGPVVASHVTVSGLERDTQGRPSRLRNVNRGVPGGGVTFDDGLVEYTNDGVELGSNTTVRRTAIVRHTSALVGGVSQHPDGMQGQQGGSLLMEDVFLDGSVGATPTLPDGTPVPGTFMRGAAGIMLNHDRAWVAPVVIRRVKFATVASVGLNIAGGNKPRYGDVYADGLEWWVKRYDTAGNLIQGVLVEDCEWSGTYRDFMIRARKAMLYENFPDWDGSRADSSGPSTWGRFRNDDGTYRDLPPGAIYGT